MQGHEGRGRGTGRINPVPKLAAYRPSRSQGAHRAVRGGIRPGECARQSTLVDWVKYRGYN